MMADKRAYFKLDVGYMNNPKVLAVLDESPIAILLHVASIGYAAQHLTNGVVPVRALLRMTGATQADAEMLYAAGLWINGPTGGKAEVHDYLKHQRSAEEVKGLSEAGKRGARARWNAEANAGANANRIGDPDAEAIADSMRTPMPREEREEREEKKDVSAARATDATPGTGLALVSNERPDVDRLCDHLATRIEANGSKRPPITKGWRDAARLMLDRDGRSEQEVHGAIDWCQADDFWRSNVMSLPKLREKFDTLRLQAQRSNTATAAPRRGDINWDVAFERARQIDANGGIA